MQSNFIQWLDYTVLAQSQWKHRVSDCLDPRLHKEYFQSLQDPQTSKPQGGSPEFLSLGSLASPETYVLHSFAQMSKQIVQDFLVCLGGGSGQADGGWGHRVLLPLFLRGIGYDWS